MPEIEVVFPAWTGSQTEAEVLSPTIVARQGDRVTWSFYTLDNQINYAEIEFEDATHQFFPGPSHHYGHQFPANGRKTRIYADVPDFARQEPFSAKYIVRGLRRVNGQSVVRSEVDPQIVVDEP
jgi:hypothetical protein